MQNSENSKAIILQKPSGTISISGSLTAAEKKIYNILLLNARKSLRKDPSSYFFTIPISEIRQYITKDSCQTNATYIRSDIEKLMNTSVDYNILGKDKIINGNTRLILEKETHITNENLEYINYSIPFRVKEALLSDKALYAKIDMVIIKGLSSPYAITLFELVKDYEYAEIPEMPLSDFRVIFGIVHKYSRISDVRKYVLDIACDELNNNSEISFEVDYKLRKEGRVYKCIKFSVDKKQNSPENNNEKKHSQFGSSNNHKTNPIPDKILQIIPKEYHNNSSLLSYLSDEIMKHSDAKDFFDKLMNDIKYSVERCKPGGLLPYLRKIVPNHYGDEHYKTIQKKCELEKQQTIDNNIVSKCRVDSIIGDLTVLLGKVYPEVQKEISLKHKLINNFQKQYSIKDFNNNKDVYFAKAEEFFLAVRSENENINN
jgi:hypothetical protein